MFFVQLFTGAILICLTVAIHAVALDRLLMLLEHEGPEFYKKFRTRWKIPMIVATVLGVFLAHIVEIWIWALFYLFIGALPSFEESLYFSTITFTTVGYGDVVLDSQWRLISSFEAANGFILFGWSTAFIFEVMTQIHRGERIRKR